MAKAELKTQKTQQSVDQFIASIPDQQQRADCQAIDAMMRETSGEKGAMWGSSIVGYGTYTYRYATGREGEWMRIGFSPRKGKTTLYILDGFTKHRQLLDKLGPHSTAKSCLYIKHLSDVDESVLQRIITDSYKHGTPVGAVNG